MKVEVVNTPSFSGELRVQMKVSLRQNMPPALSFTNANQYPKIENIDRIIEETEAFMSYLIAFKEAYESILSASLQDGTRLTGTPYTTHKKEEGIVYMVCRYTQVST